MRVHHRMVGRDSSETHRAATPLELFFDLTFVVAIAQAAVALHHGLVDGHAAEVLVRFPLAFFAIWWAWMNFTWFASAYDTDDAPYRIMVFVQMTGVLVLAAGVPRAFEDGDFGVVTAGYVIMRFAMVGQWLRAAAASPSGRRSALRYAVGIAAVQVGWVARLALPDEVGFAAFFALAAVELVIPVWAETATRTSWHPHHMAERYGLFTIIVLGESILAATVGVQTALDGDSRLGDLMTIIAGGLLIVFSMWWIYFDLPREATVKALRDAFDDRLRGAFRWGYGHYFVYAAVAATGAGLAVAVDHATGHSVLTDLEAGAAVSVPLAVYLLAVWVLHRPSKPESHFNALAPPAVAGLVLAAAATPEPVLLTGLLLTGLLVAHLATDRFGARAPNSGG